jgi:mannan endo-1,6-alpha-mannosidase
MARSLSVVLPAALAVLLGGVPGATAAYQINSTDSIIASARTIAFDLMSLYKGNQSGEVPGLLSPQPPAGDYYWYQGGGFMGAFIDYWRWTGDASYNDVVKQALLHQVGPNNNYMPLNYTAQMGNDDQCLWGLSAMLAAEHGFPNPPQDKPQWLALAQAVYDAQAARLQEEKDCNGGMRWMPLAMNKGYDYKNSKSGPSKGSRRQNIWTKS